MAAPENVHEAKTHQPKSREFGALDLGIEIPDSFFFEPMTEEELAEWE